MRAVAKTQAIDYPDLRTRLPKFLLYRPMPWLLRRLKEDGFEVAVHAPAASLEDVVFAVQP